MLSITLADNAEMATAALTGAVCAQVAPETGGNRKMGSDFQQKIISLEALQSVTQAARAQRKRVVQCHGCFDIVHPGHIRYLEFARRQGDLLIVSLTGDSQIDKGDQRPYIPQELRAENLAALMFVDYVYIDPEPTAEAVLARIQPDVYVKGREYEHATDAAFVAEKAVVEGYGGRIIFSSGEIVFSSTELIERMPHSREAESHRLQLLCRRYDITSDTIQDTLKKFRDLRVLVVGDIVLDRYILCDAVGVARESPMMSLVQHDERSYVGGAAIVARHVAAMGAQTFLLSVGAGDDASKMVTDVLTREGVEAHLIESRPTLVEKTRFLVYEVKLFKVDRGQRIPLDSVAQRRAAVILEQQSKIADAVIFCDFGYGMITAPLLSRVLPAVRQNVNILTADVSGGRNNLLHFRNVDLLCPTEREARATLNDYDSGLSSIAWDILQKTQVRHLFITLEKQGMIVFDRRSQRRDSPEWSGRLMSEQLPAMAEHGVDLLGCGDALLAASTLALAAGADLIPAAYIGNAAAAIEASVLGNHPVDIARLGNWLRRRSELRAERVLQQTELITAGSTVRRIPGADVVPIESAH
ncbi:MAG: adenylyltransferase/cytidyltransferase family protein [Planctomycetes bacterium]|nr:adenylyltransferase/cytidyltransferase family protein [Planctomycetota bacterium]